MDFKKYFMLMLMVVAACFVIGTAGAAQDGTGGQKPDANFSTDVTTGFLPLTVAFTDSSTNSPTSWSWYFGDEDISTPWSTVTSNAGWTQRAYPTGVLMPDGSIVLMGGLDDNGQFSQDVWRSTDKGATWTEKTAHAGWSGRFGHSSVALPDGSIVVMGGFDGNGFMNDVWRSTDNGATWQVRTTKAGWLPRFYQTSVAMPDGSIVLTGGYIAGSTLRANDVWRSTDEGATWQEMTANAGWTARNGHGTVALPDGSIVLMGGFDGSPAANDVWKSTDNGITWIEMTPNADWSARSFPTTVAMPDGSIILMGGIDSDYNYCQDVWRSTDEGATWTEIYLNTGWGKRVYSANVAMPDGSIVLMGGYLDDVGSRSNDVWRFVPAGSSSQNPTHTYTIPGTYTVTMSAMNAKGSATVTRKNYIEVFPPAPTPALPPAADFIGTPQSGTAPITVTFWDQSMNAPTSWNWSFGDGVFSNEAHPVHEYPIAGQYTVILKVSNDGGSDNVVKNNYITVIERNHPPVLDPITGSNSTQVNHLLQFTLPGSDPDANPLTYSASILPSGAELGTDTGIFSWTPLSNQIGTYPITFTVRDDSGLTASENITLTVAKNSANRVPVLDPIGPKSIQEKSELQFTLTATDPDSDVLRYSANVLPSGAAFDATTGTFTWTPLPSQVGTYPVTFTVDDYQDLTDSESIVITVTANQPPVLDPIGSKSVQENQQLQFTASATDSACDSLTYSASGVPSGAVFDATTGAFTWTPLPSQVGTYPVTFVVSDGSLTDSENIVITVTANQPPVLNPIGSKTVEENQQLQFTVSATDSAGDPLTYSTGILPDGAAFDTATRKFTWTPVVNQSGTYPVTFTVSDGSLTATETITITVTKYYVNQPPVLDSIGSKSVLEKQLLQFTVSATDPTGDPLTYSTGVLPSGAKFDATTRTFSWTPASGQAGTYPVTFTVSDGSLTASESITITVTHQGSVNNPPVLDTIGPKSVTVNQQLKFTVSASDPDGNTLTYSASGLPSCASFNAGTRTFSWTPSSSQTGTYTVTFVVNDGHGLTDSETITITVTKKPVNQPPVLDPIGSKSAQANQKLQFTVSATDPDGDSLTYSASGVPSGASFNAGTRTFAWTPSSRQAGSYPVTFTVKDSHGLADSEKITITVTSNQPPVFDPISSKETQVNQKLQFTVSATDPDGDSLTYSASGLPSGASFSAGTRTFAWTPTSSQAGTYTVTFAVADGHGLTDSESVAITVIKSYADTWTVKIVPSTINLKSKGVFVAFVKLPNSYNVMDVQKDSVFCRGATATRLIRNPIFPHVFAAVFKVEDLKGVQSGSKVAFTVTGTAKSNGQIASFSGIDFVKVLDVKTNTRDDTDDFASYNDDRVYDKNPWR